MEGATVLQAAPCARSEKRRNHVNGFKPRAVRTRVGPLTVYVKREFAYRVLPAALVLLAAASAVQAQSPHRTPDIQYGDLADLVSELEAQKARIAALEGLLADPGDGSGHSPEVPAAGKPESGEDKPVAYLTRLSKGRCGDLTFKPGLRMQSRYFYDDEEGNHDFFIRRFRVKTSGNAFDIAKYGAELKFDSTGRFEVEPKGVVENAWVDFTVIPESTFLRVGLYDVPFSRNALTSDSKLLFMDRTLIKSELTTVGLADNTIGLLLHGRPWGGRLEYAVGGFDNVAFEKNGANGNLESDQLMPAGRIALNLLDPATSADGYADYRESYLCQGQRLAVGANAAYLGQVRGGVNEFDIHGWGIDLFFNTGPFSLQAEYDRFAENVLGADPDMHGDGWYVQAGYLWPCGIEFAARYQDLDPNGGFFDDRLQWTSLGLNLYIREHNLKVQTDYTFKRELGNEVENDMFQMQLQIDF